MSRLASITVLILTLSVASQSSLSWILYTTQHAQQVQLSVVTQVLDTMLQREGRRLQGTALPSGTAPVPLPTGETLLQAVLLPNDTGHTTLGGYVTYGAPRCLPGGDHPPGGQAEVLAVSSTSVLEVSSTSPTLTEPSRVEAATDRLLWTVSPSRP